MRATSRCGFSNEIVATNRSDSCGGKITFHDGIGVLSSPKHRLDDRAPVVHEQQFEAGVATLQDGHISEFSESERSIMENVHMRNAAVLSNGDESDNHLSLADLA